MSLPVAPLQLTQIESYARRFRTRRGLVVARLQDARMHLQFVETNSDLLTGMDTDIARAVQQYQLGNEYVVLFITRVPDDADLALVQWHRRGFPVGVQSA